LSPNPAIEALRILYNFPDKKIIMQNKRDDAKGKCLSIYSWASCTVADDASPSVEVKIYLHVRESNHNVSLWWYMKEGF